MKWIILGILGLFLLSGCVSSRDTGPQWQSKYGAVEDYCVALGAKYVYGGPYHEGCTKDGVLVEIVCPTYNIHDCVEVKKE